MHGWRRLEVEALKLLFCRQPLLAVGAMTSLVHGLNLAPQQAIRHLRSQTACREGNLVHIPSVLQPLMSHVGWSPIQGRISSCLFCLATSASQTSAAVTSCGSSSTFQQLRVNSKASFPMHQPDSHTCRNSHSNSMATEVMKAGHGGFLEEGAACPDGYRPNVGVCLVNADDQVFVANRLDMENAWQMPQGGIDEGETAAEAAVRELREETGVTSADIIGQVSRCLSMLGFITNQQVGSENTSSFLVCVGNSTLDPLQRSLHDDDKFEVTYDFPPDVRARLREHWGKDWKGQAQKWFLFRLTGDESEINLLGDGSEKPEFSEYKWVDANQVVSKESAWLIDGRKCYLDVVQESSSCTEVTEGQNRQKGRRLPGKEAVKFKRAVYEQVIDEFGKVLPSFKRPLEPSAPAPDGPVL